MNAEIRLGPGLELIVREAGSLGFGKKDKWLRDLVRRTYEEVQVPVLQQHDENVGDNALAPKDSIGWTHVRGMLTDKDHPLPGYNHIILVKVYQNENRNPIGLRVTDEFLVPRFGNVLMEYFSAMIPRKFERNLYLVDRGLLSNLPEGTLRSLLRPTQILLNFNKQLTLPPEKYVASLSDGVGIDRKVLANAGYERFGPEGKTMVWVPPMNARTVEEYKKLITAELYFKFDQHVKSHHVTKDAALFIAIDKYIKEGMAELDEKELEKLEKSGYVFEALPAVVKTREAIESSAAQYGGYIPCSPIKA